MSPGSCDTTAGRLPGGHTFSKGVGKVELYSSVPAELRDLAHAF